MAIKNIIFDMGNVLTRFDPIKITDLIVHQSYRELVRTYLFQSPEWKLLDEGTITEDEAVQFISQRIDEDGSIKQFDVDTDQLKQQIAHSLVHWPDGLEAVDEMDGLIAALKDKGYRIYLLSNASMRFFTYYKDLPGIHCFDGLVVSAEEKCLKPGREIYQRLLARFRLEAEECFFIDDLAENIKGAADCGIRGHCFADGDMERLCAALNTLELT